MIVFGFTVAFLWESAWDEFLEELTHKTPIWWCVLFLTIGYIIYAAFAPWALHEDVGTSDHEDHETDGQTSEIDMAYHQLEDEI